MRTLTAAFWVKTPAPGVRSSVPKWRPVGDGNPKHPQPIEVIKKFTTRFSAPPRCDTSVWHTGILGSTKLLILRGYKREPSQRFAVSLEQIGDLDRDG